MKIDKQIQTLIPPLSTEEYAQFEQNLQQEGCRDALVTWRGTLLDGHNRLEICKKHGIPYETTEIDLPDRATAIVWVILNQLGRRNLTPYARAELALQLEPSIAAKAKENQGRRTDLRKDSAKGPIDTKKEVAKAAGVSRDTIRKAKALKERASEEVKQQLRAGKISINAAYTAFNRMEDRAKRREEYDKMTKDTPLPERKYRTSRKLLS